MLGELDTVVISPTEAVLRTGPDGGESLDFGVSVAFHDGTVDEDFPLVEWTLSNTTAGEIDEDGLFVTSTVNGGRTLVIATVGGIQASADVTVIYEETWADEGVTQDQIDAFEAEAGEAGDLAWTYPPDATALPRNLPEMDFMWSDAGSSQVYELAFSSSTTQVSAYTTDTEWTAPDDLWRVITSTNSGDDVQVELRALRGGEVVSAGSQSFRVSRFDVEGAVYYWSTTDQGIVRSDVSENDPEVWYSRSEQGIGGCVGCHILSMDGDRLAYTFQMPDAKHFRIGLSEVEPEKTPEALMEWSDDEPRGHFSTIDPSGTWRITDDRGTLEVYDAVTGDYLFDMGADIPLTMPDWSQDGNWLVAVTSDDYQGDNGFGQGEIVVFEHLGDAIFGDPVTLVEWKQGDKNQYYPTFSPDSKWVAFNRADGFFYFNDDAALWLVAADGSGDPIELERANQGPNLTNSWPRWAPMPDDDVLWLAFASTRSYGNVKLGEEHAQVWAAAIDTYAAETGADPSFPAFRMVQQDLETSNHTPWWSLY